MERAGKNILVITHYTEIFYAKSVIKELERNGFIVTPVVGQAEFYRAIRSKPDLVVFYTYNGYLVEEISRIDKKTPLIIIHAEGKNPPELYRNNLKRLFKGRISVETVISEVKKALKV